VSFLQALLNFPLIFLASYSDEFAFQVLACILLMRIVEFPSESQLWKGRRRIPKLYGLIRGIAAPLFFCRIALSTLEKRLMVVKDH
jgi:hypothetical protein